VWLLPSAKRERYCFAWSRPTLENLCMFRGWDGGKVLLGTVLWFEATIWVGKCSAQSLL